MASPVVVLRPDTTAGTEQALAALDRHLGRCKLAANTVKAYHRQCLAYLTWLDQHSSDYPDAFIDLVGAEGAVTAWRRHLVRERKASAATVNQALAAVSLLYEHGARLRISIARARVPRPGEPDALTPTQQNKLERAADRRGPRDAAIITLLLYTGARVEECARLDTEDLAITARTGQVRLHGKGDQVRTIPLPTRARERIRTWLERRGSEPGPLWIGQRGRLTISGITQVVLAAGANAGIQGLRPHRLRHSYATTLRQGGADVAQVQALLGHSSLDTSARYFRAGPAETAAIVEAVFDA
jgi:integrase/recombinase XerC